MPSRDEQQPRLLRLASKLRRRISSSSAKNRSSRQSSSSFPTDDPPLPQLDLSTDLNIANDLNHHHCRTDTGTGNEIYNENKEPFQFHVNSVVAEPVRDPLPSSPPEEEVLSRQQSLLRGHQSDQAARQIEDQHVQNSSFRVVSSGSHQHFPSNHSKFSSVNVRSSLSSSTRAPSVNNEPAEDDLDAGLSTVRRTRSAGDKPNDLETRQLFRQLFNQPIEASRYQPSNPYLTEEFVAESAKSLLAGPRAPSSRDTWRAALEKRPPLDRFSFPRSTDVDIGSRVVSPAPVPRAIPHPLTARAHNTLNTVHEAHRAPLVDPTSPENPSPPTQSPTGAAPAQQSAPQRPSLAPLRRQSLVPASDREVVTTLLGPQLTGRQDSFSSAAVAPLHRSMIHRKVWVKRPEASATQVMITEDDIVDDLRDAVLKKYTNSLGRKLDSPDIMIRLIPRESSPRHAEDRILGPQEVVGTVLDDYYPGGQNIDEALIIETPRRTPRPSPRQHVVLSEREDLHPSEGGEYFPPMTVIQGTNAPIPGTVIPGAAAPVHQSPVHSISVINNGQIPSIPSPGSRGSWHQQQQQLQHQRAHQPQQQNRPRNPRQHTSSPTIVHSPSPSLSGTEAPK